MQSLCVCVCLVVALWLAGMVALSQIIGSTVCHRDIESFVLLMTSGFVALPETSSFYKCAFTSLNALKIGERFANPHVIR